MSSNERTLYSVNRAVSRPFRLPEEQSDQGPHCLQFPLHLLDIPLRKSHLFIFRVITADLRLSEGFYGKSQCSSEDSSKITVKILKFRTPDNLL